jgi:divalent metal cation (Fe/Co/Zn/Cd) transporter
MCELPNLAYAGSGAERSVACREAWSANLQGEKVRDHAARMHMRRGLRVSLASIAWALTASAAEIVLGVTHRVLTLVVFGVAGALDAAGSATLVVHFRHALRHDELAERHERRATLVVSSGLVGLGVLTLLESTRRIVVHEVGGETALGAAIAAASLILLPMLAVAKQRAGRQLESTALVADGWLSMSGAVLAAIALASASVSSRDGLWWVDPSAAAMIAVVAGVYGVVVLAGEQSRHHSSPAASPEDPG